MNLPLDASSDQSNCPPDYYRRLNGMLHQIPESTPHPPANGITEADLEKLLDSPDELRKLAKGALVEIIMIAPRNISLVGAIRELLDRVDGKSPQSVSMTVKTDPVSKLSDDQLAAILANLPNSPMVIPPMPVKLDID